MSKEPKYEFFETELKKIKRLLVNGDLGCTEFLNEMLSESINNNYSDLELEAYIWKSWLLFKQGLFSESKKYNDLGIALAIKIGKEDRLSTLRNNRALVLSGEGKRSEAIKELFKCLEIHSRLKNENKVINVNANIGMQYTEMGDFENGERFFLEAQRLINLSDSYTSDYMIVVNLAVVYTGKKEFNKALKYAKQAVAYSLKREDLSYRCYSFLVLGIIFIELKEYDEALLNTNIAEKIAVDNSINSLKNKVIANKSSILFNLGELDEAEKMLSDNIENMISIQNKVKGYDILYRINKKKNKTEEALKYLELWLNYKQKNEGIESKNLLASLEAKYQNELKEKEKEILRLQKVEMEQKALRAQLNPHFFFNSLNSINKFIVDNDAENASKFLFQFSSLMRKTLENSEESFITIEDEVDYLKDYLSIEQLRFNFSFQFEIKVDEEIEEDFIKIPTMMLQPYVENCIKHGINGIENGIIKIAFKLKKDDLILCTIEDNGKGFEKSKSEHKSMGTKILNDRINNLKEQYNKEYQVEIKNSQHSKSGTIVFLSIPILEN